MIYKRHLDLQQIYLVSNTRIIDHRRKCILPTAHYSNYHSTSILARVGFLYSAACVWGFTKLPITSWYPSAEGCSIKCQRWAYTLSSVVSNMSYEWLVEWTEILLPLCSEEMWLARSDQLLYHPCQPRTLWSSTWCYPRKYHPCWTSRTCI